MKNDASVGILGVVMAFGWSASDKLKIEASAAHNANPS